MISEDGSLKESILSLSTAIRTALLPEVHRCIRDIETDFDSVIEYKTSITQWLKPIIDLSEFYVYPINGITEGLNWWQSVERRNILMDEGEYQWVQPRNNPNIQDAIIYKSVPNSADGNFCDVPSYLPVALDLAYVGSTAVRQIEVGQNVEHVFYSLSKSFGVRNIRTGWYFTRREDTRLKSITHGAKYYNYHARNVSEKIINTFSIDYVHTKLKDQQLAVCNKLGLTPSDSVWLATTENEEYSKFIRRGKIARVCLSGTYES